MGLGERSSSTSSLPQFAVADPAPPSLFLAALTGLADSREATTLLQAFIDKTGDIQTAALVAAQFWPSKKVKARYERWIETYETLLQGWDLCAARAKIEQARGRLAREQNVSFRPPKEIIVRCAFCNKNVADLRATASLSGIRGSSVRPLARPLSA